MTSDRESQSKPWARALVFETEAVAVGAAGEVGVSPQRQPIEAFGQQCKHEAANTTVRRGRCTVVADRTTSCRCYRCKYRAESGEQGRSPRVDGEGASSNFVADPSAISRVANWFAIEKRSVRTAIEYEL